MVRFGKAFGGLLNLDGFLGAFAFAGAALKALVRIDNGLAVLKFDCFGGAGVLAGAATNALLCVNFCCHCCLPFICRELSAPLSNVSLIR